MLQPVLALPAGHSLKIGAKGLFDLLTCIDTCQVHRVLVGTRSHTSGTPWMGRTSGHICTLELFDGQSASSDPPGPRQGLLQTRYSSSQGARVRKRPDAQTPPQTRTPAPPVPEHASAHLWMTGDGMMDEVRSTARMPIIICGLSCLFAPSRVTLKLIVDLTPGLYAAIPCEGFVSVIDRRCIAALIKPLDLLTSYSWHPYFFANVYGLFYNCWDGVAPLRRRPANCPAPCLVAQTANPLNILVWSHCSSSPP